MGWSLSINRHAYLTLVLKVYERSAESQMGFLSFIQASIDEAIQ